MTYNRNKTRILFSFLLIFALSNCSTLINRMTFGPSSEIQFIEKIPFEIPPLQRIQPTKDFSLNYKVGEFSEHLESIGYTDIRDNLGRNQRKQKTIYENKILEVKANGDYLLYRSWVEKEKSKCEIPNLDESWYDKNSNFLEYSRTIYNCKEYKKESNHILGNPIQKYDALTLDKPVFSEIKSEKYIAKLEIQFIGISNYRNREVALILFRIQIKAQSDKCIPTNLLFDKNNKCSVKGNELIYLDLKSKVPLLRKSFDTVNIEKEKSFSMLDPFGMLDDFFPITFQTQSIHTYTYPPGYLE